MPYAPRKPCQQPGCPEFIDGHGAYCPQHRRHGNSKKTDPIYNTMKHRNWRKMIIGRHPICCGCHERPSVIADHVLPLSMGGDYSLENGQGLCQACHNRKTLMENTHA